MITSEDLFAGGPPAWAPRTDRRYAGRRPSLYLAVTRADDRLLLCTVAVTMLGASGGGPIELRGFIERVIAEAGSDEQRERLATLLNSALLSDIAAFIGRVRERLAPLEGRSTR